MIPAYRHFPTTLRAFSLLMAALAMLFASTAALAQTMASSVSQHGITWEFDREYEVGQFITGDYWVIGPVTITSITRPNNNPERDGSMVNPMPTQAHGYDSRISNRYDPDLNVANSLPLALEPGSSLISMISREEGASRPFPEVGAVLTVLDSAPSATAFRPPMVGTRKPMYDWSQVDLSVLPNLPLVPSATESRVESARNAHSKPWIMHIAEWQGLQNGPPRQNSPSYGRDIAARGNDTALMLMLDLPPEDKEAIARGFIQTGIDLHENMMNGSNHCCYGGGHGVGHKLPGLLAGVLLGEDEMKNYSLHNDPRWKFQEDAQIEVLTQELRDATYSQSSGHDGYWDEVPLGTPVWVARGPRWKTTSWITVPGNINYMVCCTTNATAGAALVVRLMGIEHLWNYDTWLEWVDLYQGYPEDNFFDKQRRTDDWHFHWSRPFAREMWLNYRELADTKRQSPPLAPSIFIE